MTPTCERIIVANHWQLLLPTFVKSQIWVPARTLRDDVGGKPRNERMISEPTLPFGSNRQKRSHGVHQMLLVDQYEVLSQKSAIPLN